MLIYRVLYNLLCFCVFVSSNTNLKAIFKGLEANELIIFSQNNDDTFIGELISEVDQHFDYIKRSGI